MTPPTLQTLYRTLTTATAPEQIFGPLPPDPAAAVEAIQSTYRTLVRIAHPDKNPANPALAAAAFQLLEAWRQRALNALHDNPLTINTRQNTYTLGKQLLAGDYFTLHRCTTAAGKPVLLKLATDPAHNDLAARDAATLRALARQDPTHLARYLPTLVETFLTDDGTARRRAAIFAPAPSAPALTTLRTHFPAGLDPRDAAWIFNRLLEALSLTHAQGTVHGAPLPANILAVLPTHGIQLAEWAYATPIGQTLSAIPATYESWYPPEVFAKKPATPATDLYLAARTLLFFLGADPLASVAPVTIPAPIGRMITACLIPAPHRRPQSAATLHTQFKEILQTLYGPPKFRPFPQPPP